MLLNSRILIVDDEPYNTLGLLVMIKQIGFGKAINIIDRAYNGLEAVEKVEALYQEGGVSYGLIFMDLSMPFLDGYEATQRIRNFYRQVKVSQPQIIVCTGHIEDEYILHAWKLQVDEIVAKPINSNHLKTILDESIHFIHQDN